MKKLLFCIFISLFIFSCATKKREVLNVADYDKKVRVSYSQKGDKDFKFKYKDEIKPYVYRIYYPETLQSDFRIINKNIENSIKDIIESFKKSAMPLQDILKLRVFDQNNENSIYSKLEFRDPKVVYAFDKKIVSIILPYNWSYGSEILSSRFLVKVFNLEDNDVHEIKPTLIFENQKVIIKKKTLESTYKNISKFAIDYMKKNHWASTDVNDKEKYMINLGPSSENFRMWSLDEKKKTISLYYNSGDIAPTSESSIVIEIPFKNLTPLRGEYKK